MSVTNLRLHVAQSLSLRYLYRMETRVLGRSDVRVSAACLGTMTFGTATDETEAFRQMDYAVEQGVTFFDTAELYAVPPTAETYGASERIIGRWLAARGTRDNVFLATKIAGKGMPWIRGGQGCIDAANIDAAVAGSLERLQTDTIDLYQLHWPNRNSYHFGQVWDYSGGIGTNDEVSANIVEVLQALDAHVRAGRIRHIGLSNETAWGTMQYLQHAQARDLPRVVSIQNEYSLLKRLFEPDLSEVAQREQVGLLAWSPLATGLLSGKYAGGARPPQSRWGRHSGGRRDTPQAHAAVDAYLEIARKHGIDPVHLALGFVNSRAFVTSTIFGATTLQQLQHDLQAFDLALSDAVQEEIAAVRRRFPMVY